MIGIACCMANATTRRIIACRGGIAACVLCIEAHEQCCGGCRCADTHRDTSMLGICMATACLPASRVILSPRCTSLRPTTIAAALKLLRRQLPYTYDLMPPLAACGPLPMEHCAMHDYCGLRPTPYCALLLVLWHSDTRERLVAMVCCRPTAYCPRHTT